MELKPCPFCGGEIRIVRLHGSYGEPWYARCDRCEVSGYYYKTEAQAIEAWSDRLERTCHDMSGDGRVVSLTYRDTFQFSCAEWSVSFLTESASLTRSAAAERQAWLALGLAFNSSG